MRIKISNKASKQLKKAPKYIQTKFEYWRNLIIEISLRESRKYKGFHDEPLKGERRGQRSVRLSRAYRVIYREIGNQEYEIIEVMEVNKHEY
ncbi:MAG: type II toxin-antitoxin system mRNA interferase toxin, RelE/StbE family [Halobacteriovoraceae bacterium]|nr:type II toxin-antitoxin system mRNA interferase toxin, RelE/StbE family [Halobacteriovoraceae bacterium]